MNQGMHHKFVTVFFFWFVFFFKKKNGSFCIIIIIIIIIALLQIQCAGAESRKSKKKKKMFHWPLTYCACILKAFNTIIKVVFNIMYVIFSCEKKITFQLRVFSQLIQLIYFVFFLLSSPSLVFLKYIFKSHWPFFCVFQKSLIHGLTINHWNKMFF